MSVGGGPIGGAPIGAGGDGGAGGGGPAVQAEIEETLGLGETLEAFVAASGGLSDTVTGADGFDIKAGALLEDSLSCSASLDDVLRSILREALLISGSVSTRADLSLSADESMRFRDLFTIIAKLAAEDGIEITDALTADRVSALRVVESMVLSGVAENFMAAAEQLSAAITLDDLSRVQFNMSATDTLGLVSAVTEVMAANQALIDSLLFTGAATSDVVIVVTCSDGVDASDTVQTFLAAKEGLSESVTLSMEISLDDEVFTAWVMNTETKAVSSYVNFPFNSFAEIDGRYYGATDTGIYELTGDDDAGEAIEAAIRSGLQDFGTPRMKRMDSAYMGFSSDGTLVLKMVSTESGIKRERHYELTESADSLRDGRLSFEKGRKSRYWGFELANVDGADFRLEEIEFIPLVLGRRIRS